LLRRARRSARLGANVLLLAATSFAAADCATAAAEPDAHQTLRYRGFVAGAPVGEATVDIALEDGSYHVRGVATSNNWLRGFTDWRNEFRAVGRLDGLQRRMRAFEYTETDRDKTRHVIVEDGRIQVTKNGKPRARRPAPGFPDVVSALFVRPHCAGDQTVTTGRHVYQLARLERAPGGCRYVVTDDDGDTFEMSLTLDRRGTLVVPTRITVYGWLTGWIELEDHGPGESG
jgi:hypothetical protein